MYAIVAIYLLAGLAETMPVLINPSCEKRTDSCITISSAADSLCNSTNSSGNVELSLMPGTHYLSRNLTFANALFSYELIGYSNYNRSILNCQGLSNIEISTRSSIHIQDVDFYLCSFLVYTESVGTLTINSSSFHGTAYQRFAVDRSIISISDTSFQIALMILHSNASLERTGLFDISSIDTTTNFSCTGLLAIFDSAIEITDFEMSNSTVDKLGAIICVHNSVVTGKGTFQLSNNFGALVRAYNSNLVLHCTTISHNCGVLHFTSCKIEFSQLIVSDNGLLEENCHHNTYKHGMITYHNSSIYFNDAVDIAGNVLGTLYFDHSAATFSGHVKISDNTGESGGALHVSNSIVDFHGPVEIKHNRAIQHGGALYVYQSKLTFSESCTLEQNSARLGGGGIFAYLSLLNFYHNVSILNHSAADGGAMYISSTRVRLHSRPLLEAQKINFTIAFNQAVNGNGGGIYMATNSKIQLLKYDRDLDNDDTDSTLIALYFRSNKATLKGGAIFVNDYTDFPMCDSGDKILNDCFIQILEAYSFAAPIGYKHKLTNVFFENNIAQEGASYYGGLTDRCQSALFSEAENFTEIYQIHNPTNKDIDSEPLSVQLCAEGRFEVFKGESINVSVEAHDQKLNGISANLHSNVDSSYGGLQNGEAIQRVDGECTAITYHIISRRSSENITLRADGPCRDSNSSPVILSVNFKSCPPGFELSANNTECTCDHLIHTYKCDIATRTVTRQDNSSWITYVHHANSSMVLVYPYCPYDYCQLPSQPVNILLHQEKASDSLCAFNRSGVLCGSCKEGFSLVIGSSKCKKCSHFTLFIVIPIAIAGVLLVILLMSLNLTVDIGTINGLILYCNTISILNTTPSITYTNIVIEWINLSLGFETCFYNGMDQYARTCLELAFPSYLILLVVLIMIASEKSSHLARWMGSSNPVAALATLIYLSYARLLRVSMNIISLGILAYPDGTYEHIWLADGNIMYLKGKHIPLFLVGVFILFFCAIYVCFLIFQHVMPQQCTASINWLNNPRLKSFMDAYHAPFRPRYRSWCGFLLLFRTIVFVTYSFNYNGDQQVNLLCVALLSFFTICVKNMYGRVYKKWINHIETIFLVNIGVFSMAAMYSKQVNISAVPLVYASQTGAILTFAFIICYHLEMKCKLFDKLFKLTAKSTEPQNELTESAQTISTEYTLTPIHCSTSGNGTGKSGVKSASQVSSFQQERSAPKSFNELREELLDF